MVDLSGNDRTVILAVGGTLGAAPFTGSDGNFEKRCLHGITDFFLNYICATWNLELDVLELGKA